MFLSLSMFCSFVTGAVFTQTGAIPSHQRPLQQQSPWHTNVYYSWSLIPARSLSLSPLLHTHDRLSPAALFQFLRPTTKTLRGCDIALLPVIAASNAPNAALPSITQRISFHFCCSTHAISSRVPCTIKKRTYADRTLKSQQTRVTTSTDPTEEEVFIWFPVVVDVNIIHNN